jgi:5-methylthioadenosine/S-adenosylhomocysteine deaminase
MWNRHAGIEEFYHSRKEIRPEDLAKNREEMIILGGSVTIGAGALEFLTDFLYYFSMIYDQLIYNALLLTMEPGSQPLSHGYMAIAGGNIAQVGQAADRTQLPAARQSVDVGGNLVMPGLINCHCHAAMSLFRGLADDLPLEQWLFQHIFPAEARWVDFDFVYTGARLAAAELIRGGVTTVSDAYFWETGARQAFAEAGVRAVVAQGVIDFPAPGVPEATDNLRVAQEFMDSAETTWGSRLISTLFCHSPYTCGAATLQGAKALTRGRHLPFFIHLAETRQEVEETRQRTGLSPVAYLDSLGVLDEKTVAVHAVWVDEADRQVLVDQAVKVCHCPESNLKLAAGIAPVVDLLKKGLSMGLGTDGAASNNNLSLLGEMSLAARLHKVTSLDPTVLPAREVVEMATLGGARVLGLEEVTGSLAPGKEADLIIVELQQPHLTPLYDPYSHLVYAAAPGDVQQVMVQGQWLLQDRQFLTLDWEEIMEQAKRWGRKIQGVPGNRVRA